MFASNAAESEGMCYNLPSHSPNLSTNPTLTTTPRSPHHILVTWPTTSRPPTRIPAQALLLPLNHHCCQQTKIVYNVLLQLLRWSRTHAAGAFAYLSARPPRHFEYPSLQSTDMPKQTKASIHYRLKVQSREWEHHHHESVSSLSFWTMYWTYKKPTSTTTITTLNLM